MIELFDKFRHGKLRELLSSYIDDEVSDSERRRVERHLPTCEECRQELESLRVTVTALRQLPEIQTARSFAITAEPQPMRDGLGWVLGVRLAASAAAVVLVGLILADVTGLLVQTDLPEWTRQSDRAQSGAPAQPAAPAPAAFAPTAASAPAPAPGAQAAPARPQAAIPAAPAAAPVATAAPAEPPAAPAPAPAPTMAPAAAAMMADSEPTQVPTPEPSMESQDEVAEPSLKAAREAVSAASAMVATSSPESVPEKTASGPDAVSHTGTATPSPTPMSTVTATPTPVPLDTPTPTTTPTPTVTSTPTPVPTNTPTPRPSPIPTVAATVSPTQPPLDELDSTIEEPMGRPAFPLLQIEIVLGVLLVALISILFWASRRHR